MHATAFSFVRRVAQSVPPLPRVLEFGSRDVNGTVRDIFTDATRPGGTYLGIDTAPGKGVNVVADAADFRTADKFNAVVCCEVLEHTDRGPAICRAALKSLLPGGLFIVTCAGPLRAPHGCNGGDVGSEYYRGVSAAELSEWMATAGFDVVLVSPSPPEDVYAVGMIVR